MPKKIKPSKKKEVVEENLKKSPLRTERSLFMCVVLVFFLSLDKKEHNHYTHEKNKASVEQGLRKRPLKRNSKALRTEKSLAKC